MCDVTSQQDDSLNTLKRNLKEFSVLAEKVDSITKVDGRRLVVGESAVSRMDQDQIGLLLKDKMKAASKIDIYNDIRKLIRLTQESYNLLKSSFIKDTSTHVFITQAALNLVAAPPDFRASLLKHCTYPDEAWHSLRDLMFEGHFFGDTLPGKQGNFIEKYYPKAMALFKALKKLTHGLNEDIHENAMENYVKYYEKFMSPQREDESLGIAVHYLQDLTAPHHVGNYPAVPYVDHFFFEKYANKIVWEGPHPFTIDAGRYSAFKYSLGVSPAQPERFAAAVYERSKEFVPYIETALHSETAGTKEYLQKVDGAIDEYNDRFCNGNDQWTDAVREAIPLAVYASAFLFETVLEKRG